MNKISDKQGKDPEEVVQQFRDYVQSHRVDLGQMLNFGLGRDGGFIPGPAHVITMGTWRVTYVVHQLVDQQWVHHIWVSALLGKRRPSRRALEAISHALTDNSRPVRESCRHIQPGQGLPGSAWHIFVRWYDPSVN